MLSESPIFRDLSETDAAALRERAVTRHIKAGDVLFREGEPADIAYILLSGKCVLSRNAIPVADARGDDILDLLATLGGLPHDLTVIAITDCEVLSWSAADLWRFEPFASAAHHYLAVTLQQTQTRLRELEVPVHYTGSAAIEPGPFAFDGMTMLIALCDADLDAVQATLPYGLTLLRRPGRSQGSVFLALAQFPNAYPEDVPNARFAYDETTCFVPVRYGSSIGLFVPYIYPSTWEPILLGREIYGFPKRLGKTTFGQESATLTLDGSEHFALHWRGTTPTRETRLVRALSDWVGVEGRVTALAFRAGEVLRHAMQLPAYRRVDVYNHKRFLAADATRAAPTYAVDCLTRAVFGVRRWHTIARMDNPTLSVSGGALANANLTLREAYFTQLDMRLSTGQVVHDYLVKK